MNYKKWIGKKVMINTFGHYHGKIGILQTVVNTEWLTSKQIAHVLIDGLPMTIPIDKIILMKQTNA